MNEEESLFREQLAVARTYPDTLLHQNKRRAVNQAWREHYLANKVRFFAKLPSNVDFPLVIIDFGETCPPGEKATLHIVRGLAGLRKSLSWPDPSRAAAEKPAGLVRDPTLRIILLERYSPTSLRLNLSEESLLEILTYHQVPTCFLSLLSDGAQSWDFSSSVRLADLRASTNLTGAQGPSMACLGRSGRHIQLCLSLSSIRQYPVHALPRGVDRGAWRWQTHSAVMYLHFDAAEGSAVWLLVSPRGYHPVKGEGMQNELWNAIKEYMDGGLGEVVSLDSPGRLRISLKGLLAVAEWAVGETSLQLQDMDMRLSDLTRPYLAPIDDMAADEPQESVHERDLRRMAFLMERRIESATNVENNIRALRRLRAFFVGEVAETLARLDVRGMQAHIDEFEHKLSRVIENLEDLADRAQALERVTKSREEYVSLAQLHRSVRGQQQLSIPNRYNGCKRIIRIDR
ncbi:hypothetical protein CPLU01_01396 [Colletotrichum plurivorum]|uniref:CorA-like transporter domain-containing protein n=1 Tax=Colletotrichum plurivorum TaxID=2175906 RepID=A0A8H6U4C9_9PEZI|nr:hypothetical protein CPLU01_01396 [Colletotrichum plurivorum]